MTRYVLDSSALLRYIDLEPGVDTVLRIFREARDGQAEVVMSAVNWGEVVYVVAQACGSTEQGLAAARELIAQLRRTPLQILPVGDGEAEKAAAFKATFDIPYADCYAGSLALGNKDSVLVTADYDFKALPSNVIQLEFLPQKKGRPSQP